MKSWLKDIWRHLTGRTDNPVYHRELGGWSYFKPWARVRKGCTPLIVAIFAVSTLCCGSLCAVTAVPAFDPDTIWIGIAFGIPGALILGLFFGETLLRFVTTLAALILGSTTISAEVESQTFSMLRLTTLPVREIVLGKFGAVLTQVRPPMFALLIARLLMILVLLLGGVAGAILVLIGLQADGLLVMPELATGEMILLLLPYGLTGGAALAGGVLWLAYTLFQPVVYIMFFAALGVFSSSLARTRSGGIATAAVMRFLVIIGSYILGQIVGLGVQLILLPAVFLGPLLAESTTLAPPLIIGLVTLAMTVGVVGTAALEFGATWVILAAAAGRTSGMPVMR